MPTTPTFKQDANLQSTGPKRRSSVWTVTLTWCIPSGKLAPIKSVQRRSLSRQYRSRQAKPDQPKLLHQEHGSHRHGQWQLGDWDPGQLAWLDLDAATAIPATREQGGHLGNWPTQDQDHRQIPCRHTDPGAGNNDKGSKGASPGKHPQPLDFHLTQSHDWRNDRLHGHPLLLLEGLCPERPGSASISSSTLGAHCVQHDGWPHPKMKPGQNLVLYFCVQLDISSYFISVKLQKKGRDIP